MCCLVQFPSCHAHQILKESINQFGPQKLAILTLLTDQSKSESYSSQSHLFGTIQGTLGMWYTCRIIILLNNLIKNH